MPVLLAQPHVAIIAFCSASLLDPEGVVVSEDYIEHDVPVNLGQAVVGGGGRVADEAVRLTVVHLRGYLELWNKRRRVVDTVLIFLSDFDELARKL